MRVAVCEYGAGNLRSVLAAFGRLGADAFATCTPTDVLSADLAVLPGVGSAASAMKGLRDAGLDHAHSTSGGESSEWYVPIVCPAHPFRSGGACQSAWMT